MSPFHDRLSDLPDDLLLLILALIPSTKQRAATSVLSRRWRRLWTAVPSLDFPYPDFRASSKYLSVVDRLVRCYPHFHRLSLAVFWPLNTYYGSRQVNNRVSAWIDLAAARSLAELSLRYHENWALPRRVLLRARSLRVLRLHGCDLSKLRRWQPTERFGCLETLELGAVAIGKQRLLELLRACPELRNLKVVDCRRVSGIDLSSSATPLLGDVVIATSLTWLCVELPKLHRFYLSGKVYSVKLNGVVRVREGGIAPVDSYGFSLKQVQSAFSRVEAFTVNSVFLQNWNRSRNSTEPFTTSHVRLLQCDKMLIYKSFTPMFYYMMKCPSLQKLHIRLDYGENIKHYNKDCYLPQVEDMVCEPFSAPDNDLDLNSSEIESIVITKFSDQEKPMQLVEFLLKTMRNLKQLTLVFGAKCSVCVHESEEKILRKIHWFYKASETVMISAQVSESPTSFFPG